MRRRDFIKAIAGSAAVWPLAARAQQPEQVRRIGALINRGADDPQGEVGVAAFKQVLQQLGWSDGRNVRMDIRWGVMMSTSPAGTRPGRARAGCRPGHWHRGHDSDAACQPDLAGRVRGCL